MRRFPLLSIVALDRLFGSVHHQATESGRGSSKLSRFSIVCGNMRAGGGGRLQKSSCPFKTGHPERWPSGLRRTLGKRVCGKPYRGFESHSLRHHAVLASCSEATPRPAGTLRTLPLRAPASCHPSQRRLRSTQDSRYRWMRNGGHVNAQISNGYPAVYSEPCSHPHPHGRILLHQR